MSRFRWRRRSLPWILFFFGFVPLLQAEEAPLPGSQVRFDRVSLEHGLSQSSVTAIVQDSEGFLWFGTRSGLDRFDGYEFRIFRNDPDRPETLSHSAVTALFTDSRDRLWVGTEAGLNRYDPLTGSFLRFLSGRDSPSGPGGNTVTALAEDRRGRRRALPDDLVRDRIALAADGRFARPFSIFPREFWHQHRWRYDLCLDLETG